MALGSGSSAFFFIIEKLNRPFFCVAGFSRDIFGFSACPDRVVRACCAGVCIWAGEGGGNRRLAKSVQSILRVPKTALHTTQSDRKCLQHCQKSRRLFLRPENNLAQPYASAFAFSCRNHLESGLRCTCIAARKLSTGATMRSGHLL